MGPGEPQVLNFKRRKICKERSLPAEELVSDPGSGTLDPAPGGALDPRQSVLLASVSPTMFVAMGAASASVLLLAVLVAALYLRRINKRGQLSSISIYISIHLSIYWFVFYLIFYLIYV